MPFDPRELIDPAFFSRLESIELSRRSIVEGSMHGLHRSPYLGMSVEFASHREYAPGRRPPPPQLEALRPARPALHQGVRRRHEPELLPAGRRQRLDGLRQRRAGASCTTPRSLAAALAHLALKQRDAVGLTLFADTVARPPAAPGPGRTSSTRSSATIADAEVRPARPTPTRPSTRPPGWPGAAGWSSSSATSSATSTTIVGGLDHLRYLNHEVILFQVLDPVERDLSVDGNIRFRDLESGETLTTQAEGIREAYRKAVDDWRRGARGRVPQAGDRPGRAGHRPTRPTGRCSIIW